MTENTMRYPNRHLSVAPMMDWTDRHCRMFHRTLSREALLYTEMLTVNALLHGDPDRWLRHSVSEYPLALQLGGSDPQRLYWATRLACDYGFCEINLNCGCPSERVQNGAFGASLMREPALVAECVAAMTDAAKDTADITVKCRIGVDEQDPSATLPAFVNQVTKAGVRRIIVHARKAWLKGLSPKENRTVPPLDYGLVRQLKEEQPDLEIVLNGGVETLDEAVAHLSHFDGVMIGRAAYHAPAKILASADRRIFGCEKPDTDPADAVRALYDYIEHELAAGTRLHQITRHMLGAFAGQPGARLWRRTLSEGATEPGAGIDLIEQALTAMEARAAA